jgi:hypothetical protein
MCDMRPSQLTVVGLAARVVPQQTYIEAMRRVAVTCTVLLASMASACAEPQPGDAVSQGESNGTDTSGIGDSETETETETGASEPSYPAGPYGTEVGDVVENLTFVDGDDNPVDLEMFYAGPQRVLFLFGTGAWCGVCIDEAQALTPTLASQSDKVVPLGVLYEDALAEPPTAAVAKGYNNAVDAFEFVADPSQRFNDFFDPAGALPRVLLIDTATMTLVYKAQGLDEQALQAAIDAVSAG